MGPLKRKYSNYEEGRLKCLPIERAKGGLEDHLRQIILAFDLIALKFNGSLIVYFLKNQSKCKFGFDARSWDKKTIKRVAMMKGSPKQTQQ